MSFRRLNYLFNAFFRYCIFFIIDFLELLNWFIWRKRFKLNGTVLNSKLSAFDGLVKGEELNKIEKILSSEVINILTNSPVIFKSKSRWETDFKSGYVWGRGWHKLINRTRPEGTDIKVPWETSRLQWMPKLAICGSSIATDQVIFDQLEDLVRRCPPFFSVPWSCTMDVSIRALNLIFMADVVYNINPDEVDKSGLKRLIICHMNFIGRYDEWGGGKRNNHFLTNLLGLFVCQLYMFSKFDDRHYFEAALRTMQRFDNEVKYQFKSDGFHFEHCTGYHKLCTEILCLFTIFGKWYGVGKYDEILRIEAAAKLSLNTLSMFVHNDRLVTLGDNDSGCIFNFNYKYLKNDEGVLVEYTPLNSSYVYYFFDENVEINMNHLFKSIKNNMSSATNEFKVPKFIFKQLIDNGDFFSLPIQFFCFKRISVLESAALIAIEFEDGYCVVKGPLQVDNGHTHHDEFCVEIFYKGIYYSIFPGTRSYACSVLKRLEDRVYLYNKNITSKEDIVKSNNKFFKLGIPQIGYSLYKNNRRVHLECDKGRFIDVWLENGELRIASSCAPLIKPNVVWAGYGFPISVNSL